MTRKDRIRIGLVGVGNCAASLVQGILHYRQGAAEDPGLGLMHLDLGGYRAGDIDIVAAFDIDVRKVGRPLHEAILAPPNCVHPLKGTSEAMDTRVAMGRVLDGVADHLAHYPPHRRFVVADLPPADIVEELRRSGTEILLNYLPVGSEEAARSYARCCLEAGVSLINCMPVFIVSDPAWAAEFAARGIPCVGDDVKSQIGATILHRALTRLFRDRGVKLERTYQLNTGGNTDFLNMLNRERLRSKKISKTEAVQAELDTPLDEDNIHIGPSDYVPWQNDNKVCFLRMEGRGFGGFPMELELRLSVQDSPNSAGVTIDAIRCCKLARDRGIAGPLTSISAYTMKHPPEQCTDAEARDRVERFIQGSLER